MWNKEIIEGFEERLRNIAVFSPLLGAEEQKEVSILHGRVGIGYSPLYLRGYAIRREELYLSPYLPIS